MGKRTEDNSLNVQPAACIWPSPVNPAYYHAGATVGATDTKATDVVRLPSFSELAHSVHLEKLPDEIPSTSPSHNRQATPLQPERRAFSPQHPCHRQNPCAQCYSYSSQPSTSPSSPDDSDRRDSQWSTTSTLLPETDEADSSPVVPDPIIGGSLAASNRPNTDIRLQQDVSRLQHALKEKERRDEEKLLFDKMEKLLKSAGRLTAPSSHKRFFTKGQKLEAIIKYAFQAMKFEEKATKFEEEATKYRQEVERLQQILYSLGWSCTEENDWHNVEYEQADSKDTRILLPIPRALVSNGDFLKGALDMDVKSRLGKHKEYRRISHHRPPVPGWL